VDPQILLGELRELNERGELHEIGVLVARNTL
jgi:hypothetical protein